MRPKPIRSIGAVSVQKRTATFASVRDDLAGEIAATVQADRRLCADVVRARRAPEKDISAMPLSRTHALPRQTSAAPVFLQEAKSPSEPILHALPRRSLTVFGLVPWLIGAGVVIAGLLAMSQYGVSVKARVIKEGSAAILNLQQAKGDLDTFHFSDAGARFAQAYEQFQSARDELGVLGSGLGSILARAPGGAQLAEARRLIEAGTLVSAAGKDLSQAVQALAQTSSVLSTGASSFRIGDALVAMEQALSGADKNLARAADLLADVDTGALPDEKRAQFSEFSQKLPEVRLFVRESSDAIRFLEAFLALGGQKTYLMLFQNSSELRPTGGFPGSYAVLTMNNGALQEFVADDIYNPDGQIKEKIIPPLQLQHITPTWGMRDAAWFTDFPVSAQKVMEMYKRGSGRAVDGVIAINPEILRAVLEATGPISLPGYDMVLTAQNFLPILQQEVEYGLNKQVNQPKKVISDMVPAVLARLSTAPPQQWLSLLGSFAAAAKRGDVALYARDAALQGFIEEQGVGGRVHQGDEDYLMVLFSNVKGAKADAVTDTAFDLTTKIAGGAVEHTLTITRKHTGNASQYGFYRRTNQSYVRVLVPRGATLLDISGNATPTFRPIVSYDGTFLKDRDLDALEKTYRGTQFPGVISFTESEKSGFGFWMMVDPGETATATIRWSVPAAYARSDYQLFIQKQPGLAASPLYWSLTPPPGGIVASAEPRMTRVENGWRLVTTLDRSMLLRAELR